MSGVQSNSDTAELLNAGYRYALSLCANREDAQDYTHDAWIRATRRYGSQIDKKLLLTIVRHLFIDQCRRNCRRGQITIELGAQLSDETVHVDLRGECHDLQKSLALLRPVEREALYLNAVEGYSATEIASLTESTRGSVLSLLGRARAKLKKNLCKPVEQPATREPV